MSQTILLVEDSRFLRLANERSLAKAGYRVICAADGEAAVLMAQECVPDLILLDMMLPKLDGVGVIRALKKDSKTSHVPIVVLSGLDQKNEWKLRNEGAAAYFVKSDSLLENCSETIVQIVESAFLGREM